MSDGVDKTEHSEEYSETDGRCILIDTGFYKVQVWGDPEDSFDEVAEKAKDAADRAKDDVEELDKRLDGDDKHYR